MDLQHSTKNNDADSQYGEEVMSQEFVANETLSGNKRFVRRMLIAFGGVLTLALIVWTVILYFESNDSVASYAQCADQYPEQVVQSDSHPSREFCSTPDGKRFKKEDITLENTGVEMEMASNTRQKSLDEKKSSKEENAVKENTGEGLQSFRSKYDIAYVPVENSSNGLSPLEGKYYMHSFNLVEPSSVYLNVTDVSGNVIKTLVAGSYFDTGSYKVVWDGSDDNNRMVQGGQQFVFDLTRHEVRDGDIATQYLEPVKITGVKNLRFSPAPNPYGDPKDFVGIQYQVLEEGALEISVYDANNNLIDSLMDTTVDPGVYEIIWKGQSSDGDLVTDGVYSVRFALHSEGRRSIFNVFTEVFY